MPVECNVEVCAMEQERFHAVDRVVTRNAFEVHNTLGRFCDERVYQEERAQRCRTDGFDVQREVLLRAVHQNFVTTYQTHVVRLLRHTRLERIQWINLNQRTVTLKTLTHDSAINDSVVPE